MTKCPHCRHSYRYKELLPFSWRSRIGVVCSNCNQTSYLSAKFKKQSTIIAVITPILIFSLNVFEVPIQLMFVILLVFLCALIFAQPFWVRLSKEEEPLW
ncbi:TIGR04104 family putative zinc finger protein [Tenuibacillus multivorans]